jgi:hypothetical protein
MCALLPAEGRETALPAQDLTIHNSLHCNLTKVLHGIFVCGGQSTDKYICRQSKRLVGLTHIISRQSTSWTCMSSQIVVATALVLSSRGPLTK